MAILNKTKMCIQNCLEAVNCASTKSHVLTSWTDKAL